MRESSDPFQRISNGNLMKQPFLHNKRISSGSSSAGVTLHTSRVTLSMSCYKSCMPTAVAQKYMVETSPTLIKDNPQNWIPGLGISAEEGTWHLEVQKACYGQLTMWAKGLGAGDPGWKADEGAKLMYSGMIGGGYYHQDAWATMTQANVPRAVLMAQGWLDVGISKFRTARSRLYRSQILQVTTRWKALDEIYKIYMLLRRSELNISAKQSLKFLLVFC